MITRGKNLEVQQAIEAKNVSKEGGKRKLQRVASLNFQGKAEFNGGRPSV
jgi:hypothetical protein